jgi:hypothetical protein
MHSFNTWGLFRAWCHLAPLQVAIVQAEMSPELSPAPEPSPDPQPDPIPELIPDLLPLQGLNMLLVPEPPPIMGWLGSIGGILGIISFAETYITRLVKAIKRPPKKYDEPKYVEPDYEYYKNKESSFYKDKEKIPQKMEGKEAPWTVGIEVGHDGLGLQVSQTPMSYLTWKRTWDWKIVNQMHVCAGTDYGSTLG